MPAPKIEHASSAARLFTSRLHRPGIDRGAVLSFGDTLRVEQRFTDSPAALDLTLSGLPATVAAAARRRAGEGTRLYDSLADAADFFTCRADPRRAWVLVVLTDGKDNASDVYRGAPERIGRYLAGTFNCRPTAFPFLLGVGTGPQIDRRALALVGEHGRFPALMIDAFPLLQHVFATLALRVTRELNATVVRGPGFVMSQVTPSIVVSRQPIDYAFLIDRSGSMNGQA
jgi:hypothetical protein